MESPGDIGVFLDQLVPELVSHGWIIDSSNIQDFTVLKDPVHLSFNIESPSTDWFNFNPNCEISGQKVSLQEIASLMVQDHGYVKTKKGFVRIDSESQKQLKLLSDMGALKTGSKFSKTEIMKR